MPAVNCHRNQSTNCRDFFSAETSNLGYLALDTTEAVQQVYNHPTSEIILIKVLRKAEKFLNRQILNLKSKETSVHVLNAEGHSVRDQKPSIRIFFLPTANCSVKEKYNTFSSPRPPHAHSKMTSFHPNKGFLIMPLCKKLNLFQLLRTALYIKQMLLPVRFRQEELWRRKKLLPEAKCSGCAKISVCRMEEFMRGRIYWGQLPFTIQNLGLN